MQTTESMTTFQHLVLDKVQRNSLDSTLCVQGEQGWELVNVVPDPGWDGKQEKTRQFILFFKREEIECQG